MVSQTIAGGSAAGATIGGTNSKQIGLGSSSGTIDTIHSTSATQSTGRTLDLAIDGDGYFRIDTGDGIAYTRAGNFYLDNTGTLVTGDGYHVLNMNGEQFKFLLMRKALVLVLMERCQLLMRAVKRKTADKSGLSLLQTVTVWIKSEVTYTVSL